MFARIVVGLSALLLGASALAGVSTSGADFTHTTQTEAVVTADADWTPPAVAVFDPGFVISGTVELTATASDDQTTVATVEIQYRSQGAADWTSICVDSEAPWSCTWATSSVADGVYELQAIATDVEGNTETSDIVTTEVYNTAGVVIDPVPSPTRGIVVLTARVVNATGTTSITFQGAVAGSGNWINLTGCSGPGPEASCAYDTTTAPSGTYDLRAVGTAGGDTYYDVQPNIVVDNTAPVLTQSVPTGPLSGAVEITADASDAHTSVSSVLFEYQLGAGAWTTCRDDQSAPYACTLDTRTLADGGYTFRATATDALGNISTVMASRVVDNLAPTVTLTVPAGTVTGPTELTAVAADGGSGVAGVDFQYRLQGATDWSSCGPTDTSAPYACTFAATNVPNGTYDFRAVATDGVGWTTASTIEARVVLTLKLDLADLPVAVKANLTLSATWSGLVSTNVTFRRSPNGSTNWTNICSNVVAFPTATCAWNLPGDGLYYVQATTTFGGQTYDETQMVYVDTTNPAIPVLSVPAGTLNGVVTLSATGTDATSGIESMRFEYKPTGSSTWVACGSDTSSPFTCDVNTASLTDANYDFRVTAYDRAGNSRPSSLQTRAVDTAVSSVAITSPTNGARLTGPTTVTVDASSTKAVTSVTLQYRPAGGAWTTFCTDLSAPYACLADTSALPSGAYELQAILNQANGYTRTSQAVAITLDRVRGVDVQATSGTALGLPGAGDTITLTYSGVVNPGSIKAGWDGSSTAAPLTMSSKEVAGGLVAGSDYLSFNEANLGQVAFIQDYVAKDRVVTFGAATMVATTQNLGGNQVTVVVVTLNDPTADGNRLTSRTTTGALRWTPSANVTDANGNPCETTLVTESGALDADL